MTEVNREGVIEGVKILLWTVGIISAISLWAVNQPSTPTAPAYTVPTTTQTQQTTTAPKYSSPPTYNGYVCTNDCRGHEAGYEYAQDNDLTQYDVDYYDGNSNSFQEGMQSWVDEQCYEDDYYC